MISAANKESITNAGPQFVWLERAQSLHCNHGPIDLLVHAEGHPEQRRLAMRAARARFVDILPKLASELPRLRTPVERGLQLRGRVARRMLAACLPFADQRITPMAAVAGAVADEVLEAMMQAADCARIWVNNGGDIAYHLAEGQQFKCGLVSDVAAGRRDGVATLTHAYGMGGIATSGCAGKGQGGRSFSLGIADSVTVLAASAALADAAATLIANHVDLPGHQAVERAPARAVDPDSDLEMRQVTLSVGKLSRIEVATALASGKQYAQHCLATGRIAAAIFCLRGQKIIVGSPRMLTTA